MNGDEEDKSNIINTITHMNGCLSFSWQSHVLATVLIEWAGNLG